MKFGLYLQWMLILSICCSMSSCSSGDEGTTTETTVSLDSQEVPTAVDVCSVGLVTDKACATLLRKTFETDENWRRLEGLTGFKMTAADFKTTFEDTDVGSNGYVSLGLNPVGLTPTLVFQLSKKGKAAYYKVPLTRQEAEATVTRKCEDQGCTNEPVKDSHKITAECASCMYKNFMDNRNGFFQYQHIKEGKTTDLSLKGFQLDNALIQQVLAADVGVKAGSVVELNFALRINLPAGSDGYHPEPELIFYFPTGGDGDGGGSSYDFTSPCPFLCPPD